MAKDKKPPSKPAPKPAGSAPGESPWKQTTKGHWKNINTGKIVQSKDMPTDTASAKRPPPGGATYQTGGGGMPETATPIPGLGGGSPNDLLTQLQPIIDAIGKANQGTPEEAKTRVDQLATEGKINQLTQDQLGQLTKILDNPFTLEGMPKGGNLDSIQALDMSKLPKMPGAEDFSADRRRIEEAMFKRNQEMLNQRWAEDQQNFDRRMVQQGTDIGTPAYQRELESFNRSRSNAYNDASFQAMMAGGDEQSRLFGLGSEAFQNALMAQGQQYGQQTGLYSLANQERSNAINEQILGRMQPLQEYQAMRGSQNLMGQTAPVDVGGLTTGFFNIYNQNQQRQNDLNWQAQQNEMNRQAERDNLMKQIKNDRWMLKNQPRSGGGGGAMGIDDYTARLQAESNIGFDDWMRRQQAASLFNQKPSGPSWGQSFLEGIGPGLGYAAGNYLFK